MLAHVSRFALALCILACGSNTEESTPAASATGPQAPAAPAAPTPNVQLTFRDGFIQPDPVTISGTHALAFTTSDGRLTLALVDGAVDASCDADLPYKYGGDMGEGHYAVELRIDSPATGQALRPEWSVYYPRNGRTTNSGNPASAPSNHLDVRLSRIDDDFVAGEVHGQFGTDAADTMNGTFVAQHCAR